MYVNNFFIISVLSITTRVPRAITVLCTAKLERKKEKINRENIEKKT